MKKLLENTWLSLIAIFILTLFLRLINLENIPNGLHIDELYAGYFGEKLITTGKDIFGNHFPLYINMIGDFRPIGIFYITGISTLLLGFSNFAVRLPTALIGSLTLFPLYALGYLITKNKKLSLLVGLSFALSPWHIAGSRATSESLIGLFFTLSGITMVIYGMQTKKTLVILLSAIPLITSYFFYHIPRVFTLSFLSLLIITLHFFSQYFDKNALKMRKYIIYLFCIILSFTLVISFTKFGIGRFDQVSIFGNKDLQQERISLQNGDKGNIFFAKVFHNKPVFYTRKIFEQYITYFSPEFLLITGGLPERYDVTEMGLLYDVELPFILFGLYYLLKEKKPYFLIPLFILLCSPIAASITLEDSPNMQRAIFMIPGFCFLTAYGVYYFINGISKKYRKLAILCVSLLFLANVGYFAHQYFMYDNPYGTYVRNDGNAQLFTYLFQHENSYDRIYLPSTEALPIYYLFYKKDYHTNFMLSQQTEYNSTFVLGKYIFVPDDCPPLILKEIPKGKTLFVQMPRCKYPSLVGNYVTSIRRHDDTEAYVFSKYVK